MERNWSAAEPWLGSLHDTYPRATYTTVPKEDHDATGASVVKET